MLISFSYLNGRSLRALVLESIRWLLFPGSGAVIFIFLPGISRCSFDESLWWNRCIPMSFASLVGISTFGQGDVDFAIVIWAGRLGSGGEVFLGVSSVTLFLVSHTSLAPCQVLHFCPDINFMIFLVMASLRSCACEFIWYALCRQSLKQNPVISHFRQLGWGWFWTLWNIHLLSVDSFWTFDPLFSLEFFLKAGHYASCC